MKARATAIAFLLLTAAFAENADIYARHDKEQPSPAAPETIRVKRGQLIVIDPKTKEIPEFDYDELSFTGAQRDTSQKVLFLPSFAAGQHRVSVWVNGEPKPRRVAIYILIIEGGGPSPVPPGPAPGPTPEPDLTWKQQLDSAIGQDTSEGRGSLKHANEIGHIYSLASQSVVEGRFKTMAELKDHIDRALGVLLPANYTFREAFKITGKWLNTVMPQDPKAELVGEVNARVAKALEDVAGAWRR